MKNTCYSDGRWTEGESQAPDSPDSGRPAGHLPCAALAFTAFDPPRLLQSAAARRPLPRGTSQGTSWPPNTTSPRTMSRTSSI